MVTSQYQLHLPLYTFHHNEIKVSYVFVLGYLHSALKNRADIEFAHLCCKFADLKLSEFFDSYFTDQFSVIGKILAN